MAFVMIQKKLSVGRQLDLQTFYQGSKSSDSVALIKSVSLAYMLTIIHSLYLLLLYYLLSARIQYNNNQINRLHNLAVQVKASFL